MAPELAIRYKNSINLHLKIHQNNDIYKQTC